MPLIHYCLRPGFLTLLLTLLLLQDDALALRQQCVGIKGRLMCGPGKPASNIQLKLIDKDTGLDPDDQLDAGYTNANGEFELKGDTRELTNIDPELHLYHECNKGINPCPIKWVIQIPDNYIFSGTTPKKLFNLGEVNLEVELEGQTHDCIH